MANSAQVPYKLKVLIWVAIGWDIFSFVGLLWSLILSLGTNLLNYYFLITVLLIGVREAYFLYLAIKKSRGFGAADCRYIILIRFISSLILEIMYIMSAVTFSGDLVWTIICFIVEFLLTSGLMMEAGRFKQKLTGGNALI